MPDDPRIGQDLLPADLPLAQLAAQLEEVRTDRVARGRRHAVARCFDDRAVVQEIASQLLILSSFDRV